MAKKAGCGGSFDGLCCRMVIETKRVFDGCASTDNNVTLNLVTEESIPAGSDFVSARVASSEFSSYSIGDGDGVCNSVFGEIVTTFAVTYNDAGVLRTVAAIQREQVSVRLKLPNGGLIPYTIEVQMAMNIGAGAIIGANAVSVTGCKVRIIKVTAPVDILIPTYGYCKYPPCTGGACPGFTADIFPQLDSDDA
ncbi:MAG: hypothetical protein J1F39_00450 [Clostridiales bacterium]|nr:hypothetical protein [Clostridiales bacterium]